VLVLLTFIPIAFLPHRRQERQLDAAATGGEGDGRVETPAMIH
jgi:hypothetical protein